MVPDQRRAEPGTQPQKERPASHIAAECLHASVVDHAGRFPQRFAEVKANPPGPKMLWVFEDLASANRCRKTDRQGIEIQFFAGLAEPLDKLTWTHGGTGVEF